MNARWGAASQGRFFAEGSEPSYVALLRSGELEQRATEALETLRDCRACPRDCAVDRLSDERKVCRIGRNALVSSAFPHHGEEDCLRGWQGSGTIFFAGCNLACVFCQNWGISHDDRGSSMDEHQIAKLMLNLEGRGCHNINLVTPEHVAPQLVRAIWIAADQGLRLPIVWNTSAYDGLETLRALDGIVDVYMPA